MASRQANRFNNSTTITTDELFYVIHKLTNKNSGTRFYPQHSAKILNILTQIINNCLQLNYFSDTWKHAEIIILQKSNKDSSQPQNYRPTNYFLKGVRKNDIKQIGLDFEQNIRHQTSCSDWSKR